MILHRRFLSFTLMVSVALASLVHLSCTRRVSDQDTTLNAAVNVNIKGLDPIYSSDNHTNAVVAQIFEPLLHYHYLKRPLELQPLLAAEMPKVSEDGLTHTFKIKAGVLFHDNPAFPGGKGREVKAEDFVYSWKRLADPRKQSDGFWIFDGRIKGLNEWREAVANGDADYETPVEGLKALDDYTLQIQLTRPYYQLHYVLAMPQTAPVPREAVEKYQDEFMNNPVGTGPYILENWTRNSQVTLVKNPNWREEFFPSEGEAQDKERGLLESAGQKLPFAERIVFHEIIEDQPRWLNFMRGNLDLVDIPKDNFDSAVVGDAIAPQLAEKGISLQVSTEPDVTYIAFNMRDPILGTNENLRKAMSLAYDTETLIERFYNGRAIVAHSPIPPGVDGYDASFRNPYKEYNLEKAKEYLSRAGFPEGKGLPELEFSAISSPTSRQMAEYFQQNMAQIGVRIRISSSSWPQFTNKIREGQTQIYGIAWLGDYPDAENFLQLLYGGNVSPGPNGSNFQNAEFDRLYDQASKLPPGAERTRLYQQMRDLVVAQAPWIPGAHRLSYYVSHEWLKNFKRNSTVQDYLKYLRIDPKKRAERKSKL